jgi:hypothetical protein
VSETETHIIMSTRFHGAPTYVVKFLQRFPPSINSDSVIGQFGDKREQLQALLEICDVSKLVSIDHVRKHSDA